MCAMTGLNIQFLAFFGDGVNIWQVFIRMLGYYCIKASVSQVVYINVIAHLLRNLEFVLKRSRTMCAMTGFNILSLAPWGEGVRRTGEGLVGCQEARKARGQAGLEDRKVRRYEGRLFTVKSLSSFPPTLLSSDNPLPQSLPQGREAEKSTSHFTLHTSLKKRTAFTLTEGATHIVHFDDIRQDAFNLVKGNTQVATSDNIRRAAFTLAEVLITLGIIGVVAAMTMPSLIEKHQEKVLIVSARKAFSTIVNATKLAQSQNGIIGDNTFLFDTSKTSAEVAQEYAKYFNGAKVCPTKNSGGCTQYFYDKIKYNTSGYSYNFAGSNPLILLSDGSVLAINQLASCTQSTFICDATDPATGGCTTDKDGNSLGHYSNLNYCAIIIVDVNGPKAPNQYGRDVYSGRVWQNGKITFDDWGQTGSVSARNILQGIDKLQYTRF